MSLGKLCDDGCQATINKRACKVCKEKKITLIVPRYPNTGMHVMDLQHPNPQYLVNTALANKQYKLVNMQDVVDVDRTKFLHASIGSLPFSTIKQAINAGNL